MFDTRRQLLRSVVGAFGTACVGSKFVVAQGPDAPSAAPPRLVQQKNPPEPDAATRALLVEQNQKAIKKDVERLLELATELKTEVEKTTSAATLSLPLIKKSEEIEKLAKQIKGLAKNLS